MQWKHKLIQVGEAIQSPANLVCLAATWDLRSFHGRGQRSDSPGRATIGSRLLVLMVSRTVARCGVSGSKILSISARVHLLRRIWLFILRSRYILRVEVKW